MGLRGMCSGKRASIGMVYDGGLRMESLHSLEHMFCVRLAELGKLMRTEMVCPRFKQLHHLNECSHSAVELLQLPQEVRGSISMQSKTRADVCKL